MKRSRLRSRPRSRGTDHDAAHAWFVAVTKRASCAVCKRRHPQMQAHHVIPQERIRVEFPHGALFVGGDWLPVDRFFVVDESDPYRSLQQLLWDVRNGLPLCPKDHEAHTTHSRLVPINRLPAAALEFARELGLQHRLGERFYAPVVSL